jgi:hypothetical protein
MSLYGGRMLARSTWNTSLKSAYRLPSTYLRLMSQLDMTLSSRQTSFSLYTHLQPVHGLTHDHCSEQVGSGEAGRHGDVGRARVSPQKQIA